MLRHVVRLAAVALAAAAAGLVVSPTAQAATCGTASGVSVVVDFHQLGGIQTACDEGGAGEYAAAQFTDVGHALTYVQGESFVCQVDGAPSTQCVRTPPATAYWSLWWSDGTSGTWTYASVGVGSLKVPAGGYVALSWQKGSDQAPPRVAPTSHSSSPPTSAPTSRPTSPPTHRPSSAPPSATTSSAPTATSTSSDSATPSRSASSAAAHHHASTSPTASPRTTQTGVPAGAQAARPPDTSAPDAGSGLPGWVAPAVVLTLFGAAGAVAVVRRKRAGGA